MFVRTEGKPGNLSRDLKKPAGVKATRGGRAKSAIISAITVLMASLLFPLNATDEISGKAYCNWVYPTGPEDDQPNKLSFDHIYVT